MLPGLLLLLLEVPPTEAEAVEAIFKVQKFSLKEGRDGYKRDIKK
jgi:hypothetical protein